MIRRTTRLLALALSMAGLTGPRAAAADATIAVASNFLIAANRLVAAFEEETEHDLALVHGSTGMLYAQIVAGAPFDVFLAADADRPARLLADSIAVETAPYAVGRLALVSHVPPAETWREILADRGSRVAIADPETAPYGAASMEILIGIRGADWRTNVVFGENVGQAFAFVVTGNAPAGLVGLTQAFESPVALHVVEIPPELHAPIRQDAALMSRGAGNVAALGFFAYLGTQSAHQIIATAGYGVPE